MVKRFLITTALEQTWRQDVPVLFLGEWCRRYDRRHIWERMDAQVVSYHWDDREKLHRDYLYLRDLHEGLLAELGDYLNALHGVDHSLRYWRILVGPWLGYFVQVLFDRWCMLRKACNEHQVSGVRVLKRSILNVVANDMRDFSDLYVEDEWNENVFGDLITTLRMPVEWMEAREASSQSMRGTRSVRSTLRNVAGQMARELSGALCTDREYVFVSSYLPRRQDFQLQCLLGQLPKIWQLPEVPRYSANPVTREELMTTLPNAENFEELARYMIHRHLPKAYLEGYPDLVVRTGKLGMPERPQAIFTANAYSSDDVFKLWAASKTESGIPLLIGQHGGNYGMAKWGFTEDHQIAIADRFLTWGWTEPDQPNLTPAGNLKGFGKKQKNDAQGVALLIQMTMPRYSYHMYSVAVASQWLDYFEDQCRFVKALSSDVLGQTLVRLYKHDYGWCQKQRWRDRFPLVRLDDGRRTMRSLINQSRICISTYNATTYLESLSLNVPTLMFWNPAHWELRTSARPFFESLSSVGIFHTTPEGAANHLTRVWDDIDGWWNNAETQRVRLGFCDRYARLPEKPLHMMAGILRKASRQSGMSD